MFIVFKHYGGNILERLQRELQNIAIKILNLMITTQNELYFVLNSYDKF